MLGVLIVNTGTPVAPEAGAVRRFLARFLGDARVVELPRIAWLPLLYGVILPLRAPRSAANYRRVWLDEGSPLAVYSQRLGAALAAEFARRGVEARVESVYLYAEPTVAEAFARLRAAGVRQVVVIPAYPQASGTTTGPVYDQVAAVTRDWRAFTSLRIIGDYHDDAGYIEALAARVRAHWQSQGRGTHLLMSFHGIPQRCVDRGDDYARQCGVTAGLLAAALALGEHEWTLSFQSRFGRARWLGPPTDATLGELGARRLPQLDVVCPGFAVDCLETLEEIAIGGREIFQHAGGGELRYIPALNDDAAHAHALAELALAGGPAPP
jgi:ferrochelatase